MNRSTRNKHSPGLSALGALTILAFSLLPGLPAHAEGALLGNILGSTTQLVDTALDPLTPGSSGTGDDTTTDEVFTLLDTTLSVLQPPNATPERSFAPIDRPGPALSVPLEKLQAAVSCTANAASASRNVALFVPGTTATPQEFSWNWFRALDSKGYPYCAVTLPNNAMSDAQISAEYIVHAVRHIREISDRPITLLGHSQGGTVARFALRFWPDLRPMVDDYIAFGATNPGSVVIRALCPPVLGCAPSLWQQISGSLFVSALNSGQETFEGISYTQIYTKTDEFVQPNLDDGGTTSLRDGPGRIANIAIQDICPLNVAGEHIAIGTYDATAYAIAMDAMNNDGPADPNRIRYSACSQVAMPGVDLTTLATNLATVNATIVQQLALAPKVPSEPPLKEYVFE